MRRVWLRLAVNLATVSSGINIGWPSPIIPQLRLAAPPVGKARITEEQISWISSLLPIGALMVVPFSGLLSERFGRKGFGYLAAVPSAASWLLVIFGTSHVHFLYAARLVGGMGASMSMYIAPLYVSEIAGEQVRGALGSLLLLSAKFGILFAYVAGSQLSYRLFAVLSLLFPVGFAAAFLFVPETPVYLVRSGRTAQAEQSLLFLRANDRELAQRELARLRAEVAEGGGGGGGGGGAPGLARLLRDRGARRGLLVALGAIAGQQLSGILAMISYAEPIFARAAPALSAENSAMAVAAIQVLGSYAATLSMERAGRRLLSLVSCAGMALCHALIGSFLCLHERGYHVERLSWLPLAAFSAFMVSYCLGMGPVPFVITSEVFRNDVSSLASTLCYVFFWAMAFVVVKMFATLDSLLGGGCFLVFAGFCLASFVFCYSLLPETRGRTREDIVRQLAGVASPPSDARGLAARSGHEVELLVVKPA